jgi:hypothetical protein
VGGQPVLIDIGSINSLRSFRDEYGAFFQYNDQDKVIYPERGWRLLVKFEAARNTRSSIELTEEALEDLSPEGRADYEATKDDLSPYDRYERIAVDWSARPHLSERATLIFDGAGSVSSRTDLILGDQVNLGGMRRPDRFGLAFWGLFEYDGTVSDLAMCRLGLQWRFGKNFFLQGAANGVTTGFQQEDANLILGDKAVLGYGGTAGLRTKLGIVQFGWGSNTTNWQSVLWLNIGFRI